MTALRLQTGGGDTDRRTKRARDKVGSAGRKTDKHRKPNKLTLTGERSSRTAEPSGLNHLTMSLASMEAELKTSN